MDSDLVGPPSRWPTGLRGIPDFRNLVEEPRVQRRGVQLIPTLEDPMRTRSSTASAASFVILSLVLFGTISGAESGKSNGTPVKVGDYVLTGPYAHGNLAVFLIHGADRLKDKTYLTLQEGMERKIVVVRETGNVNELSIENVSPDQEVYVQSGDIVKGGRQDRMIAMDFILPARSGQMPIDAFCVEHGRWTQRGAESDSLFATSDYQVAGKDLKLAAKQRMDQSLVWQQVAANQKKLTENAGKSVQATDSASSLQLSLESKPVEETTAAYVKALEPTIDGNNDVIGYAFAINGKVNSADVYASHALFVKLWPKLIKSSAVEAVAETQKGIPTAEAKVADVYQCMSDADKGAKSEKSVTARVRMVTRETEQNVVFQTLDGGATTQPVHENFVNKK